MIAEFIRYFQGEIDLLTALEYGILLCLGMIVISILHNPAFLANIMMGLKCRVACSGLIYKKIFTYDFCTKENIASGRIMNLIATDVTRFERLIVFLPYLIIAPTQAVFVIIILCELVDVYFLTGFCVLASFVLMQYVVSKLISHLK